ncbi:Ger(x)C family spore germination protein [Sediminibacillus halophilus]|uniref:Germination protein, Ger(X)C family n=1 Tax=Sediminibacillus halophilus TaxID=482461 RepID=A0A1G9W1H3_9BACI|nr:Ger(x)C family spore germination protein [Sediminibacillus halophilus]SDM78340.1 germination protein, Ger(x)C family [Sediminibacillus halophilus]
MARFKLLPLVLSLLLLTGCWDQRQFKNVKLVLAAGVDAADEGKVESTVVITNVQSSSEGPGAEQTQIVSAAGHSPLDTRTHIDQKISKRFDQSKLHVLLLGEELAKKDIYAYLDMFYRDPKSNLHAQLAVVGGTVKDALSLSVSGEPRISEYITGMLTGERRSTHMPNTNIQLICSELLEPGQDFVLPYLTVNQEESILEYRGLALFSGQSYSGSYLPSEKAVLFLLMKGIRGADAQMTRKVGGDDHPDVNDFITVDVKEIHRKLSFDTHGSLPKVEIKLKMEADVLEYPPNHLQSAKKIKELEKQIEKDLTKEAKEILGQLQEVNSDALGLGRRLQAYHPKAWKKLNWNEVYADIEINPSITFEIQSHGITN